MAHQIVKQPDGRYAVWSTIVDDFVIENATPKEIADTWAKEEADRVRNRVDEIVAQLDQGGKPYHQFTKTYGEFVQLRNGCYPEDDHSLLE